MKWQFGVVALLAIALAYPQRGRFLFPEDAEAIIDVKRDLGAKGDGLADDTEALQKGIDLSCGIGTNRTKILYLPNGVYRITKTLVVRSGIGPWIYGESRDGVIIKLDKGTNCEAVLRTHPRAEDPGSADWFMRTIYNLTIDVGENPQTDGVRFFSNNTGLIKNLRVRGHGRVGINSSWMELNGPNMIQDTVVEGFEIGVSAGGQGGPALWGQTLSRVTIRNCSRIGLEVRSNCVAAEDLRIENVPLPVICDLPEGTDWFWWGGVLSIVGGEIKGNNPQGPAILNRSVLYVRDLKTKGYAMAIKSETPNGDVRANYVEEYLSHGAKKLFEEAPSHTIKLPIKREPEVPWERDKKKWVCANDFGAQPGDNKDDTEAIQRAIDWAVREGKTVIYLRGVGGPDPNWYTLEGEVRIYGSVRYIIGCGFGRIIAGPNGKFIIDDQSAPVVKFENIQAFGGTPAVVENRSKNKVLVLESCDLKVLGTGKGDIFMTNCPSHVELRSKEQSLWARQLNPEGGGNEMGLVRNEGGNLWILGMKCEGDSLYLRTANGGKTELFGAFLYTPGVKPDFPLPLFDIDNAKMCIMGVREISFGNTYPTKMREKRGEEVRLYQLKPGEHGWIGWALYSGW